MRFRLLPVLLVTAGLAVAGCGPKSTPASTAASSSVAPSPTSSPSSPAPSRAPIAAGATDSARAQAIMLSVSDLPAGWKSQPNTTTHAQQVQEDTYFDNCLGVPVIDSESTVDLTDQFQQSGGLQFAESSVDVTRTVAEANQDNVALMSSKDVSCNIAAARKFLTPPSGGRILSVTGSALPVPSGYFGVRVVTEIRNGSGQTFSIYLDDIGLIVKRFEVQVGFGSAIQLPPASLEASVSAKVFARADTHAS